MDWDPIASDINYYLSNNKFTPYGDRVLRAPKEAEQRIYFSAKKE